MTTIPITHTAITSAYTKHVNTYVPYSSNSLFSEFFSKKSEGYFWRCVRQFRAISERYAGGVPEGFRGINYYRSDR